MRTQPVHSRDAALTPERLEYFAGELRSSQKKREVFKAAYKGKRKAPVDARHLANLTGYSKKAVNEIATGLARKGLLIQPRESKAVYERDMAVMENRDRILRLATSRTAAARHTTMRSARPQPRVERIEVINPARVKVKRITIDDIDQLSRVRRLAPPAKNLPPVSEDVFKRALVKLLPGTQLKKDWGGERNDIYTDHIKVSGKRLSAAFALKGPAQKPPLTPGKMGKNGDQVQRLVVLAPVDLYVIQFEGQIDESIFELLEYLLRGKSSMSAKEYFYCVIDGADSARIRQAYPTAFRVSKK
jgi:hypothetical protein